MHFARILYSGENGNLMHLSILCEKMTPYNAKLRTVTLSPLSEREVCVIGCELARVATTGENRGNLGHETQCRSLELFLPELTDLGVSSSLALFLIFLEGSLTGYPRKVRSVRYC